MSDYIFYSLFEKKMIKMIIFLNSKQAFRKESGILSALSKSKINKYKQTSKNKIFYILKNIKKSNFYYFILCSYKVFNKKLGEDPLRHIYSYI